MQGDATLLRGVIQGVAQALADADSKQQNSKSMATASSRGLDELMGDTDLSIGQDLVMPESTLSDRESTEAMRSVLNMVDSSHFETRVEGARILCDLSASNVNHVTLCHVGCLAAIAKLLRGHAQGYGLAAAQAAAVALAHLSESACCQDEIINAGLLPELLRLAVDSSYLMSDMSEACALAISNLCRQRAERVVGAMKGADRDLLSRWITSVDEVENQQLKMRIGIARDGLLGCNAIGTLLSV